VLKRIIIRHLNAHFIILDRKIKGRLTHPGKTDLKNCSLITVSNDR
jgi:hypothetical protein